MSTQKHKIKLLINACLVPFILTLSRPIAAYHTPNNMDLYDRYPWGVFIYHGLTVTNPLIRIFYLEKLKRWPENIQSLELAHTLAKNNWLREFVSPLVGVVQFAVNFTIRNGERQATIYELDPYFAFRWTTFAWNDYVNTSFAIGEGVSYDTSVPAIEKKFNKNTKRFLNYLMFEATFASPNFPQLQMVARIHHRSGAYGLYRAGNSGSNDIGLGIRLLIK